MELLIAICIGIATGTVVGGAGAAYDRFRRDLQNAAKKHHHVANLKAMLAECDRSNIARFATLQEALETIPENSPLHAFVKKLISDTPRGETVTPAQLPATIRGALRMAQDYNGKK